MGKKRTKGSALSEMSVVERARSLANQWMWAVSLQHDRITTPRSQDKAFHPFGLDAFNEADVHYLVIALRRLRTVATTLEHAPQAWSSVRSAIEVFDTRLPWLKNLRDVFEHVEDYAVDSNLRRSATSRSELQVWSAGKNGIQWLGYDVDWKEALSAARDLYDAVKTASDSVALQPDVESGSSG